MEAVVCGDRAPELEASPLKGNLEEQLPDLSWDECLANVLAQSPELDAARTNVDRARLALQRADREWIPNIDVGVGVRHHNVASDNVASVQVGFPLPIYNANQGNIQTARGEWMAAQNRVRQTELQLRDRLATAFRQYANARQQAAKYNERILPHAAKSLEIVTNGYRERQVGYLTLLVTQKTYYQVNLAYLDALRDLRESAAFIDGQLLSDSLSAR